MEKTYAFIDASNIIYGTRDEGWKVDFRRLFKYLKERYKCQKIFYFAGKEEENAKQVRFYKLLDEIGYELVLKSVKIYIQPDGSKVRKANCDVDLTFYAMRDVEKFDRIIFMSGDGDFEILLRYFLKLNKKVLVLANGARTARGIRRLAAEEFTGISSLRKLLEFKPKKSR